MNRLFWKFFLAFWLAMTVFALTGFYSTSAYLEHLRATDESSSIRDKRDDYIGQARDLLAKSGWQALLEWLEAVSGCVAATGIGLADQYVTA
jgi:two-component system sensor histidine kinase CpxA